MCAFCLPIGGAYDYTVFFHEAGHAQHFGWSSRELIQQYPEFLYAPDHATCEAHAFLLNNLFRTARGSQNSDARPDRAQNIMHRLSLLALHNVRRHCAKLIYEKTLHDADANTLRSTQMKENYATLLTEATGFARSPELYLWDVDDSFTRRIICARGHLKCACANTCACAMVAAGGLHARRATN
jgi:oligoendopeptidase F